MLGDWGCEGQRGVRRTCDGGLEVLVELEVGAGHLGGVVALPWLFDKRDGKEETFARTSLELLYTHGFL